MKNKTGLRLVFVVLTFLPVYAVTLPAAAQGLFLSRGQQLAALPDIPRGLSVVDSTLYLNCSSVLLKALRQGDDIVGYVADTEFVKLDEGVSYVVRHPTRGDLYFTRPDRHGQSCLFCSHRDGKRVKTKRVKMGGIAVEHPVFSADGRVMVFSSAERRRSYGGYDLWYSTLNEDEWSDPVNMGNRVNSQGDEVSPCIVGDCLFYSSNGRDESKGHLSIFATRLIARQVTGDTIGMLQIGRSRVQHLPHGINSAVSDCQDFVVDTLRHCCYWVNASSGLRSYKGTLSGITVWGHIYDNRNQPLSGVSVTIRNSELPNSLIATSGPDGFYRITLSAGALYRIQYSKPLFFAVNKEFEIQDTEPLMDGNLFDELQHDIVLDSMPVGRSFYYTDLYGPDAVVDLSDHGIATLQPLVTFLNDNSFLAAELTLTNDLTDNAEFNALLTEQRLKRLEDYLRTLLSADASLQFHNGCAGRQGCSDATGVSRLTIMLRAKK